MTALLLAFAVQRQPDSEEVAAIVLLIVATVVLCLLAAVRHRKRSYKYAGDIVPLLVCIVIAIGFAIRAVWELAHCRVY